jgi:large subunit ribosomal protein L4
MAATKTTKKSKAEVTPSLEATIYSQKGASVGSIALPSNVFGVKWNDDLVHQVMVSMMANKRAGTAHTKDRSEVSGGGKKPWKQKGTGRARHGSSRSPIWTGGGITFGPRNDKDYSKKINKKMRVKALYTVLSRKFAEGHMLFIDTLSLNEIKTKDASAVLSSFSGISGFERIASKKRTAALIALPEHNEVLEKSFANLPGVTVVLTKDLNALSAMSFNSIIVVNPNAAIEGLAAKMK